MIEPELSKDEPIRLMALRATRLLDTPLEDRFERLTRMARMLLDVPVAAVSLIDADRQWFKSIDGLSVCQTSRAVSFCGHAILNPKPFVISDARLDDRFKDNPLVTGEPHIVFYAGIPISAIDGSLIATLCVIDYKPREISTEEMTTLEDLAQLVETEIRKRPDCEIQRNLMLLSNASNGSDRVDEVTRLWNRESIDEMRFLSHAESRKRQLSSAVILADVDNHTQVLNAHGSEARDELLRQVAKRILSSIRSVDAVGRVGEDQFMVVLEPGSERGDCLAVAQRIRQRIAESPIALPKSEHDTSVSVGLGYHSLPTDNYGSAQLKAAERALASAKLSGKNRVAYECDEQGLQNDNRAA
ncbi:MAG: sensor domain-containing diguanylate cyclase [Phycisphaerales bacterium]